MPWVRMAYTLVAPAWNYDGGDDDDDYYYVCDADDRDTDTYYDNDYDNYDADDDDTYIGDDDHEDNSCQSNLCCFSSSL